MSIQRFFFTCVVGETSDDSYCVMERHDIGEYVYFDDYEKVSKAVPLLKELFALVNGECPSLLDEDSGGCSRLYVEIEEILLALEGVV